MRLADAAVEALKAVAKAGDTAAAPPFVNRYCHAQRRALPPIKLPLPTNPADAARAVVHRRPVTAQSQWRLASD